MGGCTRTGKEIKDGKIVTHDRRDNGLNHVDILRVVKRKVIILGNLGYLNVSPVARPKRRIRWSNPTLYSTVFPSSVGNSTDEPHFRSVLPPVLFKGHLASKFCFIPTIILNRFISKFLLPAPLTRCGCKTENLVPHCRSIRIAPEHIPSAFLRLILFFHPQRVKKESGRFRVNQHILKSNIEAV